MKTILALSIVLCLIVIHSPAQDTYNGGNLSNAELNRLHTECMSTPGYWQGLPPIANERMRYNRWMWWRNKPQNPYFMGMPAFVQLEEGAWFGDKFILIVHPDSSGTYDQMRRERDRAQRLHYYRHQADRDSTTVLRLARLGLDSIPEWVYEFKNLRSLNISNTAITHLPARLNELDSLQTIIMDHMRFADSLKIDRLSHITRLSLQSNALTKLPWWVLQFPHLEELDLSDNHLDHIPNKVFWLPRLHSLKVSKNPLVLHRQALIGLRRLTALRINSCNLTEVPRRFFTLRRLTELQLSDNALTQIPPYIAELQNLTSLSLYKNQIAALPPQFYQLTQLQVVDLYYNEVERIGPEIGQLDRLEILYLANNKLYDLPAEIGELPHLRELYLHHNRLSDLPDSFANLSRLNVFHIHHNYFLQFPEEILSMDSLQDLDFSYNEITTVPMGIAEFSDIRLLFLIHLNLNLESPEGQALERALNDLQDRGVRVGY